MLNFGEKAVFNKVILYWEDAFGKAYEIQVSDNKKIWENVYSTGNRGDETDEIKFDTITARYVRMYGTRQATRYGYHSLWKFSVEN
ncbi:discoidin domain-containing protein [bacterium]|nr:discoidin domain-containing protein [bacterium]